jgi:hypothetical protein
MGRIRTVLSQVQLNDVATLDHPSASVLQVA